MPRPRQLTRAAAGGGGSWEAHEHEHGHNARQQLLATAFNNLALAVVVAGFLAPAIGGQLQTAGRVLVGLVWIGFGAAWASRAWETAGMTWAQVVDWIIWPGVATAIICAAGLIGSRLIP